MKCHLYSWAAEMAQVVDVTLRQPDALGYDSSFMEDLNHDGMYLRRPLAHKLSNALKGDGRFLHTPDAGGAEAGWFTVPHQAFAKGIAYYRDEVEPGCVVFWWFNEDPNFN